MSRSSRGSCAAITPSSQGPAGIRAWGLVSTAKKLGLVQELSRLCPAARRKAEFFFLGDREQKLALCNGPTAFRTFYKAVEAADNNIPRLASPMDLPTHMTGFNDKLARALDKAIGLR